MKFYASLMEVITFSEDIGHYNAVAEVIGAALLKNNLESFLAPLEG